MKKIAYLFTIVFVVVLTNIACNQNSKNSSGFIVTGTVEGLKDNIVIIERISMSGQTVKLKDMVASEDKLNVNLDTNPGIGYYRVRSGRGAVFFMLDGTEQKIEINGKFSDFNNNDAIVSGSTMMDKFMNVLKSVREGKTELNRVGEIAKSEDPLVGAMILANVYSFKPEYIKYHEEVSTKMTEKYPDLYLTSDYAAIVQQFKMNPGIDAASSVQVGKPAPEIAMPDQNGKIKKLSELKGKIVLIDFWASWCGPCIRSFPELTEIYEQYKDKGFTVYSVSLDGIDGRSAARYPDGASLQAAKDAQKTRWVDAIKKHNLNWDYHVSDLDKWDCKAAKLYGVESIPRTFLLDKKGNIAAINPRFNLKDEIEKVLAADKK